MKLITNGIQLNNFCFCFFFSLKLFSFFGKIIKAKWKKKNEKLQLVSSNNYLMSLTNNYEKEIESSVDNNTCDDFDDYDYRSISKLSSGVLSIRVEFNFELKYHYYNINENDLAEVVFCHKILGLVYFFILFLLFFVK